MYDGSSLGWATVGGAFIGAVLVLVFAYIRVRCRKYVNGDYRRVPLDYDFELNPRLKNR